MSKEPINSFAARIARKNEVQEFIDALIKHGVPLATLKQAIDMRIVQRNFGHEAIS